MALGCKSLFINYVEKKFLGAFPDEQFESELPMLFSSTATAFRRQSKQTTSNPTVKIIDGHNLKGKCQERNRLSSPLL